MARLLPLSANMQQLVQAYNDLAEEVNGLLGRIRFGPGFNTKWTGEALLVSYIRERPYGRSTEQSQASVAVMFFGRITGSAPYGSGNSNQWEYSFWEVEQVGDGYGESSWQIVEDGHHGIAHNGLEVANTAGGVQGTGVDTNNLEQVAPGMSHQPIPPGVVLPMFGHKRGSVWSYWFAVPNGIDGSCEVTE